MLWPRSSGSPDVNAPVLPAAEMRDQMRITRAELALQRSHAIAGRRIPPRARACQIHEPPGVAILGLPRIEPERSRHEIERAAFQRQHLIGHAPAVEVRHVDCGRRSRLSWRRTAANCSRSKNPARGAASLSCGIVGANQHLCRRTASRKSVPRIDTSRLVVAAAGEPPRRDAGLPRQRSG
jgi:hypothetical protein